MRVVVYQTVNGSSGGAPVETNYVCGGAPAGVLGVDDEFGNGLEAGVTAGNNIVEVDEPPNLSNRTNIYAGGSSRSCARRLASICATTPPTTSG